MTAAGAQETCQGAECGRGVHPVDRPPVLQPRRVHPAGAHVRTRLEAVVAVRHRVVRRRRHAEHSADIDEMPLRRGALAQLPPRPALHEFPDRQVAGHRPAIMHDRLIS